MSTFASRQIRHGLFFHLLSYLAGSFYNYIYKQSKIVPAFEIRYSVNLLIYNKLAVVARQGPSITNIGVSHFPSTACDGSSHRAFVRAVAKS